MRTSFHHQPEAQHPNFQLSTSWQADYPIFRGKADMDDRAALTASVVDDPKRVEGAITRWVNMEMTTMTLKVQYLTKLEEGTQIRAGWYVTTPFCPEVVFATEQEALAYGRTEELRQELMDRVRAMSFDELFALKVKMT